MAKLIDAFTPVFTHDQFFKSEIAKIIFALTHMDTYSNEENDGFIKLTDLEYFDKEKLDEWYNNLTYEINSARGDFSEAEVLCALNSLKMKYNSTCLIIQSSIYGEEE